MSLTNCEHFRVSQKPYKVDQEKCYEILTSVLVDMVDYDFECSKPGERILIVFKCKDCGKNIKIVEGNIE